jgi:hypothetical protein
MGYLDAIMPCGKGRRRRILQTNASMMGWFIMRNLTKAAVAEYVPLSTISVLCGSVCQWWGSRSSCERAVRVLSEIEPLGLLSPSDSAPERDPKCIPDLPWPNRRMARPE